MSRFPRNSSSRSRGRSRKSDGDSTFKIKLRGRDNTPLSMQEVREGLLEAADRLQQYEGVHRAKWLTVYLTMVDEDGEAVMIDPAGEWTIFPYKSAADEHGA